jgi:hypothetical protein
MFLNGWSISQASPEMAQAFLFDLGKDGWFQDWQVRFFV